MTLQTTIDSIDPLFPVAGKDNDSQGFRDNFNYIKTALTTANAEVIELQSKTVLTNALGGTSPVDNNLDGSSINNGFYNNFHGISHLANASGAADIYISDASVQQFRLSSNTTFTFRGWPADGKYAVVRIHFLSNGVASWNSTFFAAGGGTVHLESSFPTPLSVTPGSVVPADGKHKVIEAWSYNSGATVYVRYLGEF